MEKLSSLVTKYYPEEIVQKETGVLLTTSSKLVTGREITGFFNSGSLPIPMIETDKKYYFDIRPIYYSAKPWLQYLKNPLSIVKNILIFLFVLIFGGYIIGGIFIGSGIGFKIFLLIFFGIGLYIVLNYNRTEMNILALKKEWIIDKSNEDKKYILKWSLPKTEMGFSMIQLLSKEKQDKLPIYLKFQSGMWASKLFPIVRNLSPVSFAENTYSYIEV